LKSDGTISTRSNTDFSIQYGSGEVSGNRILETVHISTLELPSILIGEVTHEDSLIAEFDMDGLCGLAFDGLSVVTRPGLIDTLQHSFPNLSHSFSFYLNTDPSDPTTPSMIIFGGYDLSLVSESAVFYYTPVIKDTTALTYWTVSLEAFEISLESSLTDVEDLTVQFSVCSYG
jgi:Eukaryotic aspartyl protease